MSLARALALLVLVTGCGHSAVRPAEPTAPSKEAAPPAFATASDVRPIEAAAPIPLTEEPTVSPLPNQPRLPVSIAGLEFGRPMADTASRCLVPVEPVNYEGIQGETTRCRNAPARIGDSTPEVILYAISGTVNGLLFSYPDWQSAAAIIPEAYGDPKITEGEDDAEREVSEFRGETTRKVDWELENGHVVLFYEDGWHLLFAYQR